MGRNKSYDKEEVLEKAKETFWKKGYNNTSMRDLSKSTGINSYSLYAEFTDKETLFRAVLSNYQKQNLDFARKILSSDKNGYQRIQDLFSTLIKSIKSSSPKKGCLTVKTTSSFNEFETSIQNIMQRNDENFIILFQTVIEDGQKDGSIKNNFNSKDLAYLLYNTHHGIRTLEQTLNYNKLKIISNTMLSLLKA